MMLFDRMRGAVAGILIGILIGLLFILAAFGAAEVLIYFGLPLWSALAAFMFAIIFLSAVLDLRDRLK